MRSILAIWFISLVFYASIHPNGCTKKKGKGTKVIVVSTHHGGGHGGGWGGWPGWGWGGWDHGDHGWGWGGWHRKKRDIQAPPTRRGRP